jgi:UDP-glucose 4-epimerase
MRILVTGGAGYIGSHTALELLEAGHDVVAFDNLSNASRVALDRVAEITGRRAELVVGDVTDADALGNVFAAHSFDAVIHFAGLKSVGESVANPLAYFDASVTGTIHLVQAMKKAGLFDLVFSSSACVYGIPTVLPATELTPTAPLNPYGRSKLMVEKVLEDLHASDARWSVAVLRYFNPVGAHPSGRIGEAPNDVPNNLMPFVSQVAVGKRPLLRIFGDDYDTPDGTGVRDYVHVVDLARGHLSALDVIQSKRGMHLWNLGTGTGTSVMQLVRAFEEATGRKIPFEVVGRRAGDPAAVWADVSKAARELDWKATRTIENMCRDAWRWQSSNPQGYD